MSVMIGAKPEIFGGTKAAEFPEVMVEVRLIGIAEVECQVDPVDVVFRTDGPDHMLEAFHPAK